MSAPTRPDDPNRTPVANTTPAYGATPVYEPLPPQEPVREEPRPYYADDTGRRYEPHDLREPVEREREASDPPRRGMTLLVFGAFAVLFGVVGYFAVTDGHVVVFDAMDRLSRAYLVWHNDPPKLAAIGFVFPPLTTLAFIPFALIKPVATSLIAMPVMTALFMGGTMVMLDRALARCEMPLLLRLGMLIAFGINPLILFYGGNGMSEAVYLFFLGWALYCFVAWYITVQPRFLVGAGIAMSAAVLTRYGLIFWALMMMMLVGAALIRRARIRDEVEGSVIAFGAPIIYALTLWTLFNAIIVGDPINWITGGDPTLAVNAVGRASNTGVDFADVAARMLELVVYVSPLALIVLPLLLVFFVIRKDDLALWMAVFVALGIVVEAANALLRDNEGLLLMRDATPIMLAAAFGAGWLYRIAGGLRIGIGIGAIVVLLATLPLTWEGMRTYPFQNEEQAFTRYIASGGESQEGTNSIGGFKVGIDPELQMAAYIKRVVPERDKDAVLTDNAQTFGVILLNGRPQDFLDRADRGDTVWRRVLRSPYGRVRFLLAARQASGDLVRQAYPEAVRGQSSVFPVAFVTERYILLRVPRRNPRGRQARAGSGPQAGARTRGITPSAPGIARELEGDGGR